MSAEHAGAIRAAQNGTPHRIAWQVMAACVPGIVALLTFFGAGTLINIVWAVPAALTADAAAAWLLSRRGNATPAVGSAVLGGLLIAIAFPPAAPWWLVGGAAAFASGVVRRLASVTPLPAFNPAMLAYALALLLFPQAMMRWTAPDGVGTPPGILDALRMSLGLLPGLQLDGFTMATPLAVLRHDTSHTVQELYPLFPQLAAPGWGWVNAGFLAGGLWLAWRRIVPWQQAASMLAVLALLALFFYDGGSSASSGSAIFQLSSGGTQFGAWFVLTEPHGAPQSARARVLFGALVGALVFALRRHGVFADGIAIAVLCANACTPLLERLGADWRGAARNPRTGTERALHIALPLLAALLLVLAVRPDARSSEPKIAITPALLDEVLGPAHGGTAESFDVQDEMLLGLGGPRSAWRLRKDDLTQAVVLPAHSRDGYGGALELLVGIDRNGILTGVRVLEHDETAGIGDAIETRHSSWILGLQGRSLGQGRWALRADGGGIDQYTGATVSSRAVVDATGRALRYFEQHRARLLDETAATGNER